MGYARNHAKRRYLLALGLLSSVPQWLAAQESATPQAQQDQGSALGTVTVTARRREENAQDVPAPITTVSGQTLETQRIYKIQDLQQTLPSVNISHQHSRVSSFAIRGIGNNPANDGLESSTGIYLDNVFLGRPGMAVFDLLDVEQVDLLSGPQGTLFGKNTTAGVLNITTRKPTFTPEHSFEVSGGQDGYFQGKGSISGPFTQHLAGRLSFYRTREDGYLKNDRDGRDLLGGERQGFRGQLLFQPSDKLSLRWISEYNSEDSNQGSSVIYGGTPTFWQLARELGAHPRVGHTAIDARQHVSVHQSGHSLEVNWKLAGGSTLTSVSAFRDWHFTPANDPDGLELDVVRNAGYAVRDRQFSQELRLASPTGGLLDYVLGAYAFKQDLGNRFFQETGKQADPYLLPWPLDRLTRNARLDLMNQVNSQTNGKSDTKSYALFAQGVWHLTERLDLTTGLRGTYETRDGKVQRFTPEGPRSSEAYRRVLQNYIREQAAGAYDSGSLHSHNGSPSGLLNLGYRFSEGLLGYALLSHGEKSGGLNLNIAEAATQGADSLLVGPERANDAEIGIKSQWLDNRLLVNANLFYTEVNGYQATGFDPSASLAGVFFLTNAADLRSKGAELTISARPVHGLNLSFNGSYNDVTYRSFKEAQAPGESGESAQDLSGKRVAGAPKWIANFNGEYRWRRSNGLQPFVAGSYSYRSNAPGTLDDSRLAWIDSYALVNLSAGAGYDLKGGQLEGSLWIKNAFDKEYYLSTANGLNGLYVGYLGQPRTVGASLRYDF